MEMVEFNLEKINLFILKISKEFLYIVEISLTRVVGKSLFERDIALVFFQNTVHG